MRRPYKSSPAYGEESKTRLFLEKDKTKRFSTST
jgi:hypothetical protein